MKRETDQKEKEKGNGGKKITGLGQLKEKSKEVWSSNPEPELELPHPSSIDPAEMSDQVEKISRDQNKLRAWTISILGNIDQRLQEANKEKDPQKNKIAQRLASMGNREDQAALDLYLRGDDKDPFHKQIVWLTVFEYYLKKPHQTQIEVQATINKLTGLKYLTEDAAGQIKACGKTYSTDPVLGDEIETVKKFLSDLVSNVLEIEKKNLFARADLTVADFLAGKAGLLALTIHAEEANETDGKRFWRKGGVLLVQSDGNKAWSITASGGIEKTIQEGMEMKVSIFLDSLSRNVPPIPRGITAEKIKKIHSLWYIIRRGLMRHKFAARGTITKREFFLEGKPGVCYLDYNGTWDVPGGPRLANFFFLVSREENDGVKSIRLVDTPDHLKGFFSQCMEKYPEEGQKFENVPQPLRAVLQAGYGQLQENEKKSAQLIG